MTQVTRTRTNNTNMNWAFETKDNGTDAEVFRLLALLAEKEHLTYIALAKYEHKEPHKITIQGYIHYDKQQRESAVKKDLPKHNIRKIKGRLEEDQQYKLMEPQMFKAGGIE